MSSTGVFEHAYYIGSYMGGILYGVDLVMYFMTVRQLMRRRASGASYRFFLMFSTALVLLLTMDISVNAVWGEIMWINARDQPGGVTLFIETQLSNWYQAWGSSTAVGLTLLSDALLIYRLFVIYSFNVYVIAFPVLVYLAATALAILELVTSFTPGGFFFGAKSVNFGTPYYSLTIGLNVVVTALIVYRLLSLSRLVKAAMGEENARLYTGVAAVLVESAAPYSLTGLIFLIPYARGSLVSVALGQVWAKFTCLAPQLIILRVVSDQAWTRATVMQAQSGDFGFVTRRSRASGRGRPEESSDVELSTHIHPDLTKHSAATTSSFDKTAGFSTSSAGYTIDIV